MIRMRRRWFFVTGAFTFVVERPRGGGFTVARVPSSQASTGCRPSLSEANRRKKSLAVRNWSADFGRLGRRGKGSRRGIGAAVRG